MASLARYKPVVARDFVVCFWCLWAAVQVLISAGFYLAAVMSKSASILLPSAFVLLYFVFWVKSKRCESWRNLVKWEHLSARRVGRYVLSKSPFWLVFGAFVWMTVHFNAVGNGSHLDNHAIQLNLDEKILKALMTPTWVARQYLWPANLRMHYQVVEDSLVLQNPAVSLALVAFVAILLRTFRLYACFDAHSE